ADYHLLILKEQINEGTISNVKPIMDSDRIEEISRLIGGVNITDITRLQAKEMLTQAQKLKEMKGWSF
ncbi:MAG: DNA repair protein RecN, partial [Tissierellia bacterium]|nr:DNA repair protein RecN [Tissierellia bacterium]